MGIGDWVKQNINNIKLFIKINIELYIQKIFLFSYKSNIIYEKNNWNIVIFISSSLILKFNK